MPRRHHLMQQLKTSLTITIPEELVLITKTKLEQLEKEKLMGLCWSMKDLEKRTNKKSEWLKEHLLYPQKFREILDTKNGGYVYYPESRGKNWSFHTCLMAKFLDRNFNKIFLI